MNITSKDLPDLQMDTTFTSPQGCAAAQRALDYYLKPAVSEPDAEERFFGVNSNLSGEESLVHASDLLRCAAATAFKAADGLQGVNRDLAFSVVHMVDMARAMVDHSLDGAVR
ncbi:MULTISPECIES: DUF6124 family protein [Pseudomonas]|uniref:DUF3077 domain-containing protein n=1 Tax=Pseudomonas fluorescens TaxID=294 RepID=A0AAE2AA50_PSEFL|nr:MULTISPECIES: DUF3077 domain-containing protein [Pseudomonas]ANI55445.1 hypothetical protein PDR5_37150 [Pseudomonas sp. DR 5-09]KIF61959.1 hypothetical protein QS95_08980 [Pseudomonas fluorescens]MBP3997834.1 DUF3077 domain-containing protein [Pseudomonas koreensis]MDP9713192.1 hypothetical protein [Pseudomonas fluorescens]POA36976.1 DUF3077 domain-containing protein [Pseudomonas sp. GW456-12-1-14-TSB6]